MFRVLSRFAASAAVAFTVAGSAHAGTVDVTGISGVWSATDPFASGGLGTDLIQWGTPAYSGTGQSGYEFQAAATPMVDLDPETVFDLGTFTHHNNPIYGPTLTGATLDVAINLMVDGTSQQINTSFDFSHLESYNAAPTCANGAANGSGVNANGCGDRVVATQNAGVSETIIVGNDEYVFVISGFMIGDALMDEFWTMEEAENSAILQGRFTLLRCFNHAEECDSPQPPPPSPVPLPAAGWMLLAGLGGMITLSRRRKA
jgi:hypothetical protein